MKTDAKAELKIVGDFYKLIGGYTVLQLGYTEETPPAMVERLRESHLLPRVKKIDMHAIVQQPECEGIEFNNLRRQVAREMETPGIFFRLSYIEAQGLLKAFEPKPTPRPKPPTKKKAKVNPPPKAQPTG